MNGYQPKLKCNNCVNFSSCNNKKRGKSLCKDFKECVPAPPNTGSLFFRTNAGETLDIKTNRPPIKLELVQYPYSKAGRPTVYLDDYQIAGPRAFGVGHTVASYELKEENLKDIQRIVTRELNSLNSVKTTLEIEK